MLAATELRTQNYFDSGFLALLLVLVSELDDRTWVVTGLADDFQARISSKGPDGLAAPTNLEEAVAALERFLTVALG